MFSPRGPMATRRMSAYSGVLTAIALPQVVAPALNLSAFTQSQVPVPLRPDVASFAVPLAGLALVTIVSIHRFNPAVKRPQRAQNVTMTSTEAGSMVATYLLLRKAIGWIGTLLPMVVIVGDAAFSSAPLPNSLSDFYYTPMRNILVGSLCVLGVFLMLYDVSVRFDRWITNAAGAGVLGVAFLPGSPPVPHLTTSQEVIGNLHVFFAAIAFLGLAVTMWRFGEAISDGPDAPPPSPRTAVFYRVSACVMLGFVLLSGVAILLPLSVQNSTLAIFDTEALAIFAFGISWLVKGRALQPLASAPALARILGRRQGAGSAGRTG